MTHASVRIYINHNINFDSAVFNYLKNTQFSIYWRFPPDSDDMLQVKMRQRVDSNTVVCEITSHSSTGNACLTLIPQ